MRIALHDRDGHLVCPFPEDVPNYEKLSPFQRNAPWFIRSPERQQILPGVPELLAKFDRNFVISNQKLRNKTIADISQEAIWLMRQLPLDGFLFCPDDGQTCYLVTPPNPKSIRFAAHDYRPELIGQFRKPQAGMVEVVKGEAPIALEVELFGFGDRLTDKICFEAAGAQFEWSDVARGYPDPTTREMT